MHRLHKIISDSLNRRKSRTSSTSSSRESVKPKKLDRSYAFKNINYEPSQSGSASSSEESLRRRHIDLYDGKTSFRLDGTDGQFEFICESCGFSGIDDFAISPEEYEAMKVRSSASLVFSQKFEADCDVVECSSDNGGNRADEVKLNAGFPDNCSDLISKSKIDAFVSDVSELSKRLGDSVRVNGRSIESRGNCIKGLQPPVLVPPREFVLDDVTFVSGFERGFCSNEDGEGTQESNRKGRMVSREENYVLSESCSFTTTSIDDDFSSTITTPLSSISPSGKFRPVIEDWQKGELLGRGSFGSVYEGIADDGFFFAVKEVSLLDQGDEGKQRIIQLEQEIALLSQFEHENIVRYYGTKKDTSHLYIFLELVTKGSLLRLYQKYDLRVQQVSAYTRQILLGLKYLHNRNVVHRDIKCANILVGTNGLVKLADFGLAKAVKLNDVKSCKGTAFWMAPEVVRSQGYGLAADIWSLGCTVLEMLTRRFPYSGLEWMSALFKIGEGERPLIPDSLPGDARDFILKCLQVDASLRPTASQLLDHTFVKLPLLSSSGTAFPHGFGRQI